MHKFGSAEKRAKYKKAVLFLQIPQKPENICASLSLG